MQGCKGLYKKPSGAEEIRWHFPTWGMSDGKILHNVSIFPHLCDTCAGGDHTHVELDDTREPIKTLEERDVVLPEDVKLTVDMYLHALLLLNAATAKLAKVLG